MRPKVPYNTVTKYFDTIEHNLNQAVYYCAAALNYIITFAGYTDCGCSSTSSGENPNPPIPDGDKDGLGLREGLKLSLGEFQGLFYFNIMGLMSTVVALSLLNSVKLLEEFIPI